MTPNDLPLDCIPYDAFEERNFYFWVRTVIDALDLIGPETDSHLENMIRLLLGYYSGADVSPEAIERIPREILRLRGKTNISDNSPIGRKYRCTLSFERMRQSTA